MPRPSSSRAYVRRAYTVTDFLLAKAVGKGPMDREKCIEYFGSEVAACKELK